VTEIRSRLLLDARKEAERHFDEATCTCIIPRETAWYAITLLESAEQSAIDVANNILSRISISDGTHSPCTLYVMLQRYQHLLSEEARKNVLTNLSDNLAISASVRYSDGNVNHPLAAYVYLLCGGEFFNEPVYRNLGKQLLKSFQRNIAWRRHRHHRQAEMAEYNSPTYTALTLWFLAIATEFVKDREAQALALLLEEGLWINVAMHWHEPSQQFAGPFSRAYGEDSYGGFSALHCTMACALNQAIFMEPLLVGRFAHPSALIQNSLPAILTFHPPAHIAQLAFEKPLPYYFRMTTYCEQYHENGVITQNDKTVPAFDDEVYPGGWGDLTTFMTKEYCLGTASRPYVNAGQSDSFTLRYRRSATIKSLADFRSLYTRMVFNDAVVGQDNFCHSTGFEVKKDYLYEEGRAFTCQHKNMALVCYTPKRTGHSHIKEIRLDLIFSYVAPFDHVIIDNEPWHFWPFESKAVQKIVIADHRTYIALIPLAVTRAQSFEGRVRIWQKDDHLMISLYNYVGEEINLEREELSMMRNGFACLVESKERFASWQEFSDDVDRLKVQEKKAASGARDICFQHGDDTLSFRINPVSEHILQRQWNGKDLAVQHLEVEGNFEAGPLLFPSSFYTKGNSGQ
jgi:hypothetical protein